MSKKTNEEKLKILQERLSAIKKNQEVKMESKKEENKKVSPVFEEDLVNDQSDNRSKTKKKGGSVWRKLFLLVIFAIIGTTAYYLYNNNFKIDDTIHNIKTDISTVSEKISSMFGNKKSQITEDNLEPKIEKQKKKKPKIIYEKSAKFWDGKEGFIIILESHEDKSIASKEAQYYTDKGYNCNILNMQSVSSSNYKMHQTFLGPFEFKKEAIQLLKSPEIGGKGKIFKLQ